MKLNNKGFTLVEILAVITIFTIITGVALASVISSINTSKESAYKLMVNHIVTASQTLYEEIDFGNRICNYNNNGKTDTCYTNIDSNTIDTNLQTLVSNGFLTGSENECVEKAKKAETSTDTCDNKNNQIIKNAKIKNESDIGFCTIKITKISTDENIEYKVESTNSNEKCPTDAEYIKYSKGVK